MKNFTIQLDRQSTKPLYIQIFYEIKDSIVKKEMVFNEKLPSIRKLAEKLEVNNDTVIQAYKLLEQEGYIASQRGKGTFVTWDRHILQEDSFYHNGGDSNSIKWDFVDASPHPDTFQVGDFKKIIQEVLDRDGGEVFAYQASEGYYPLREAICQYLRKSAIGSTIGEIHIISGAQQGIDILAKALLEFEDVVVIESPSYPGARKAFESRGAKLIEIPMETDGMNMIALEKALKKHFPRFIYVMPNFHNPTGISYSMEKRKRLLSLAKEYGSIIIEDDYLSDFHFGYKKRIPLKALDKEERVIYIKSFSKIFMPGFRLGFLVSPREYEKRIRQAKQSADLFTMGLVQRSFDLILRGGFWRNQIMRMEEYYQKGFQATKKAIETLIPKEVSCHIPEGTLYFWFKLPQGYDSKALYYEGIKRGIGITPGEDFFIDNGNNPYFRITYGNIKTPYIHQGIQELGQLIEDFLRDYNNQHLQHNTLFY